MVVVGDGIETAAEGLGREWKTKGSSERKRNRELLLWEGEVRRSRGTRYGSHDEMRERERFLQIQIQIQSE